MCLSSQTPCGSADSLRGGASIDRSDQPQDPGYRLGQDATQSGSGQRTQRSIRADLTQAAQGTARLLADRQASDLMAISRLLGHSSFATTMVYLHCRRQHLGTAPSPIDWLPVRQCPKWVDLTSDPHSMPEPLDEQAGLIRRLACCCRTCLTFKLSLRFQMFFRR